MEKPTEVLAPVQRIPRSAPAPRPRLLIEWESRHRVFLDNLADLFLTRPLPPLRLTSKPARFWGDVFVPTGAPWSSFMEAVLWQVMVTILLVWAQSKIWVPVKLVEPNRIHRAITYYPPTSFPAAESRASKAPPRSRKAAARQQPAAHQTARQTPMPVRPEQKPSLVTPPDIKQAAARPPDLPASHFAPPMTPFSATADLRRNSLAEAPGAVAPPVQVDQAAANRGRGLLTPQATVVAPAPEVRGSGGRSLKGETGGLRVVPPPPAVQSAGNAPRARSLSNAGSNVVPPAPSVPRAGKAAGDPRVAISGAGSQAIPPPPSVRGARGDAGAAALGSTAGSQAVPPPPSTQGAAGPARNGRLNALSGTGPVVVPPAPSVAGAAKSPGNSRAGALASQAVPPPPSIAGSSGGKGGSLTGAGGVVPPPPSVTGSNGAKYGSLAGAGAVPPPPSVESGSGDTARTGSLSGDGSQVIPPAPSVESAGNTGVSEQAGHRSERERELEPSPTVAATNVPAPGHVLEPAPVLPTPSLPPRNEDQATIEELPLGLLGLVFAAPGSSYFSNFEVFVAKRRMGKDKLQLIKLVYEFLPYQKRLSEYNLNNLPPRVIKLRVIPDPSCNESLGQIIQPAPDPSRPVTEYPKLPVALSSADMEMVLPCYRTSAGDFEKAMAKSK